jgi:uncharacterized membrane protein
MTLFILGLIVFFLPHLVTALARSARESFVRRIGEGAYKGFYSILSALGLALIVIGWPQADTRVLYVTNFAMVHVAMGLMLAMFICLAAAYMPAGKIAGALKHPMLVSVKLWSLAHLLVNGDVRSVLLFGSFLAYAVIDRIAVKRRGVQVRAAGPMINDLWAVLIGSAAFAAVLLYLHPHIAGVPVPGADLIRERILSR